MEKLFKRLCPKCGEVCQAHEIASVELCTGVQVNMQCSNNHRWSEFYYLTYTGFWWDGKRYNSYGEEIIDKNI